MNVQLLMSGVFLVSLLTGLTTEAIKNLIGDERKSDNLIAVICACVLSIAISVGYVMLHNLTFTTEILITIVAMIYLSFLTATIGYDKLVQTLKQLGK